MKKVEKLIRKNGSWENIKEYSFKNRNYMIDKLGNFYRNNKIIITKPDKRENLTMFLIADSGEKVRFKIHQIVIQTFNSIENITLLSVDHINKNRLDNRLENLRYADYKTQFENRENVKYKYKKVLCLENNIIYNSSKEAENKLLITKNTVARVARGERKKTCGYSFIFYNN